jgi:hypothetical protein
MLNEYVVNARQGNWINWLSRVSELKPKLTRVFDYRYMVPGMDYVFDQLGNDDGGYMTSQRRGVKVGNHILLMQGGIARKYQIQELDYYSSPGDMWIALLKKLDQ